MDKEVKPPGCALAEFFLVGKQGSTDPHSWYGQVVFAQSSSGSEAGAKAGVQPPARASRSS